MTAPTLADLRALLDLALTHEENPAIQRLEARCSFSVDCNPHGGPCFRGEAEQRYCDSYTTDRQTVDRLVEDCLSRRISEAPEKYGGWSPAWNTLGMLRDGPDADMRRLDLTDRGTFLVLLAALALALGSDPRDGVIWTRIGGVGGWRLLTVGGFVDFETFEGTVEGGRVLGAPAVATEPDRVNALVLAVKHVLEAK